MSVVELSSPRTAILKVAGTNCDNETQAAFEKAGARAEIIHLNQLKTGEEVVYCDVTGVSAQVYPDNPNSSQNAIAGITDPSGKIL